MQFARCYRLNRLFQVKNRPSYFATILRPTIVCGTMLIYFIGSYHQFYGNCEMGRQTNPEIEIWVAYIFSLDIMLWSKLDAKIEDGI